MTEIKKVPRCIWHCWGKNWWTWREGKRDFPSWNAKEKKDTENKITHTKYSIRKLREIFKRHITENQNIRRRRKLKWSRINIWNNNSQEHPTVKGRHQTTNPRCSENMRQNKYNIKYTQAYYALTVESQREPWKEPEKTKHLQKVSQQKPHRVGWRRGNMKGMKNLLR